MAIKDFVYNSDYPMDYIVWKYEGKFEANPMPYSITEVLVEHHLPFAPLAYGVWSPYADFHEAYDINDGYNDDIIAWSYLSTNQQHAAIEIYFTDSSIKEFYVRIFGIRNPSYDGNVEAVQIRDDYRKNTDYNYPKIYMSGVALNQETTIYHNLGYIPQIRVYGTTTSNLISPVYFDSGNYAKVTEQTLFIKFDSYNPPFYYLIFGDGGIW